MPNINGFPTPTTQTTLSLALAFANPPVLESVSIANLPQTVVGTQVVKRQIRTSTSATTLELTSDPAGQGYLFLQNLDQTNTIALLNESVGGLVATLRPNDIALLNANGLTISAISNSGTPLLSYLSLPV